MWKMAPQWRDSREEPLRRRAVGPARPAQPPPAIESFAADSDRAREQRPHSYDLDGEAGADCPPLLSPLGSRWSDSFFGVVDC